MIKKKRTYIPTQLWEDLFLAVEVLFLLVFTLYKPMVVLWAILIVLVVLLTLLTSNIIRSGNER